jgi:hypothetical protein
MGEKEGMYIIFTYCEKIEEQRPYFLKIYWWMGMHTPIIIDLEALKKFKSPPFV